MIILLVVLASIYQAKVSRFDKAEQNVLERAKEAQAANIGEYSATKIKAGEIAELQEADAVMKKIFQNEKKNESLLHARIFSNDRRPSLSCSKHHQTDL